MEKLHLSHSRIAEKKKKVKNFAQYELHTPFNPQKNKVLKILFYEYIYNVFKRNFAEVPKFCHIRLDESEPDANSQSYRKRIISQTHSHITKKIQALKK